MSTLDASAGPLRVIHPPAPVSRILYQKERTSEHATHFRKIFSKTPRRLEEKHKGSQPPVSRNDLFPTKDKDAQPHFAKVGFPAFVQHPLRLFREHKRSGRKPSERMKSRCPHRLPPRISAEEPSSERRKRSTLSAARMCFPWPFWQRDTGDGWCWISPPLVLSHPTFSAV